MREKRETLHFAYAGFRDQEKRTIRAEQSQPQYTTPPENYKPFDVDAHLRAARRAMVDAYCLLKIGRARSGILISLAAMAGYWSERKGEARYEQQYQR